MTKNLFFVIRDCFALKKIQELYYIIILILNFQNIKIYFYE